MLIHTLTLTKFNQVSPTVWVYMFEKKMHAMSPTVWQNQINLNWFICRADISSAWLFSYECVSLQSLTTWHPTYHSSGILIKIHLLPDISDVVVVLTPSLLSVHSGPHCNLKVILFCQNCWCVKSIIWWRYTRRWCAIFQHAGLLLQKVNLW